MFTNFYGYIKSFDYLMSNKYIIALSILIAFIILSYILLFFAKKYIYYITKKTKKTKTDIDKFISVTYKPLFYFLLLIGIYFSTLVLNFSTHIAYYVNNIIKSMLLILILVIVIKVLSIFLDHWGKVFFKEKKPGLEDVLPLVKKFNIIIFILIGFLIILDFWNINLTGFLAGVGIAGIVIGFALKDSLSNVFGGISLILDKAYKVGDKVKLDSGELGVIYGVGLRSTRLKTFDNEVIIIPNNVLANTKILNYAQPDQNMRVSVTFGVEYGSDVKKVIKIANKSGNKVKDRSKEIDPRTVFFEIGPYSLIFKTFIWVDNYTLAHGSRLELTDYIYNDLKKEGIEIAFPTNTIHLKK